MERGEGNVGRDTFSVATNVDVYFCEPRSPWQRGTNENTNRLLRQYLPKQSDLGKHSQARTGRICLIRSEVVSTLLTGGAENAA
jgi:IS30 family transposase